MVVVLLPYSMVQYGYPELDSRSERARAAIITFSKFCYTHYFNGADLVEFNPRFSPDKRHEIALANFDKCKPAMDSVIKDITDKKRNIYTVLNDFAKYMTEEHQLGKTQRTNMAHLKSFLISTADIDIVREKFKDKVKMERVYRDRDAELTHEQVAKIISVMPEKIQLLCLIMVSTIRRPKEINLLRVCDFDFSKNPIEVTVPARISKNGAEGTTFLTKECGDMLKRYITKHNLTDKDRIFPYTLRNTMTTIFRNNILRHLPEMCEKTSNGRHKVHLYSMKKFGYTQVEEATNRAFAEDLKGDLAEYRRLPPTERIKKYAIVEPHLSIFNQDALRHEILSKNADRDMEIKALKTHLYTKELEIEELRKQLSNTKAEVTAEVTTNVMANLQKQGFGPTTFLKPKIIQ